MNVTNETINEIVTDQVVTPKPIDPSIAWIIGIILIFVTVIFLIYMTMQSRKSDKKKTKKVKKAEIKSSKVADKQIKKFKWFGWFRKKEYETQKDIVANTLKPVIKRNDELFALNKTLSKENAKLNTIKIREFNIKNSDYFDRLPVIRRYFEKKKLNKHPEKSILIRMEMNNGRHREFIMHEDSEKSGFQYNKGRYIFDLEKKYYILDSNIWAYDFHESFTLPVERRIPVDEIKNSMELAQEITEVNHATNPKVLENFIISEIAQGIMKGAGLGVLFKMLLIVVIGVAIFTLANLGLNIYSSGIIEQLQK